MTFGVLRIDYSMAHFGEGRSQKIERRAGKSRHGSGLRHDILAAVVRDGLRIYPFDGATPPDLDKIFTDDLAGVEFYARAALAPTELREVSMCGALVLWSR